MAAASLPYKLYGGATRADAISGLNPDFAEALTALYQAAPADVQAELGLNSAYRSPEIQRQLWEKSDKTGRTVAAPGKSKHQHGTAADLYGFGLKGGAQVSPETRQWVAQNAAAHGLYFPMNYEPWHIQLQGNGTQMAAGHAPSTGAQPAATAAAGPTAAAEPSQPAQDWISQGLQIVNAGNREPDREGLAALMQQAQAPELLAAKLPRARARRA